MRQHYHARCSISQQHEYFRNPQAAALRLVPTAATAAALQRAGLWLKSAADQLHVLGTRNPDGTLPDLPPGLLPLRFGLEPLSSFFENVTDLPGRPASAEGVRPIFCFRTPGAAAPAALNGQTVPALPLTPQLLALPAAAVATLTVADVSRGVARPAALLRNAAGDVARDAAGRVQVDVRAWDGGHYQLRDGATVLLDFYADDQLYRAPAWGVLEVGGPEGLPAQVQLAFAARRTRWRYLIRYQHPGAAQYRAVPEALSVTATGRAGTRLPTVEFARVAPRPGTDVEFESGEALALAELPGYQCSLRTTHPAPLLVAQLPLPGPELLARPDPPGPARSEIVVHL